VLGIGAGAAGLVLLGARVFDAFVDPLAGILSDRTSTKWGKYRPWVVGTAVPFALVFALSYLSPDWGVRAKTAWAAGTYALLMALYSFNNTPYSSLGGVMTDDGRERTSVATVRFVAATVATIVVQVATLPMVKMFEDPRTGWSVTVGIYAVFAVVMLVVSGCVAKERIAPPATQKNSIREDLRSVFGDVPWRAMFTLTLFLFVTLALWGSASAYYFKYAVPEDVLDFSLFNGVGQGITFVAVVTLPGILSDRFGKKATYLVCLALTALFTAGFYFVPATSRWGLLALCALKSLAYAPTIPLLWAMMGDVADHSEWKSGRRATGFVFAGIVFALKAGLGLGGAVCGWILGAAGFDPSAASQTPGAQEAILLSVSLIPAALFSIGVFALAFYPISKRVEVQMQSELNKRRGK
jgi:sugar (glycoside-pentoside-hexuronide) transporter